MPHKLYDAKAHNTPTEGADYLKWLSRRLIDLRRESAQDSMKALVSHVKGYILQHYDEDVSLNKLAGFVHVNASYLSRVSSKTPGKTSWNISGGCGWIRPRSFWKSPACASTR